MEVPGTLSPTPVDEKKPKITYPGFSLSDSSAEAFVKECEPELGDEFAATVRLKVTSLTADEYGNRVQFDVMDLDDISEETEEKDEDKSKETAPDSEESDDTEEKVLGYKRKTSKKPAPDISAKSLED